MKGLPATMFHACVGVYAPVHDPHHCPPSTPHGHPSHRCYLLSGQNEEHPHHQSNHSQDLPALASALHHHLHQFLIASRAIVPIPWLFGLFSPSITAVQSCVHFSHLHSCHHHHNHLWIFLLHIVKKTQLYDCHFCHSETKYQSSR